MQITNGEKEGIGYFVAGSGVCMTPKCEKWKTKGRVQRTTFTCLIILLILTLPFPKKFSGLNHLYSDFHANLNALT